MLFEVHRQCEQSAVAVACTTKCSVSIVEANHESATPNTMATGEPYNRLQAAVSTLSKGPVAASDKIGASNAVRHPIHYVAYPLCTHLAS
jgi:hypothetical protein